MNENEQNEMISEEEQIEYDREDQGTDEYVRGSCVEEAEADAADPTAPASDPVDDPSGAVSEPEQGGEETVTVPSPEATRDEPHGEREAAREELLEFAALYPNVSLGELPEAVRRSRLPLAAAYALYERREALLREEAERENRQNSERSAGGLTPAEEPLYSPAEVRRMTREEIRVNYDRVMRSMKTWR